MLLTFELRCVALRLDVVVKGGIEVGLRGLDLGVNTNGLCIVRL